MIPDIIEKILIHLDVRDLLRFKSVCKSWLSLISSPDFIKSHLNHSYDNYYSNNEIISQRMLISSLWCRFKFSYQVDDLTIDFNSCLFVGSCNGLVCIFSLDVQVLLLVNPSTRQVINVRKPQIPEIKSSLCWGFGYDSCNDDYKVVLGFMDGKDRTCFQVLSLKSNVWKLVGGVDYNINIHIFMGNVGGTLCNGGIHWFMENNQNKKNVILCFDLSKEEFKEIPQPDDGRYEFTFYTGVGTVGECLCIFRRCKFVFHRWVMKNYNVKQSWELLPPVTVKKPHHLQVIHDCIHWLPTSLEDVAQVFVPSLVSPHLQGSLKRKRQIMISKKNDKVW